MATLNNGESMCLPRRIILVRHGESQGNKDETVLEYVPNYKIKLSDQGSQQARMAGSEIKRIVGDGLVSFYVSPSNRTWETLEGINMTFTKDQVLGIREECRLREQHFGNFQETESRRKIKRSRDQYGKFFYRVPDGESSADVYDRVSTFLEGLWRDIMEGAKHDQSYSNDEEFNLVIVSHGLTILLILMKWFGWTVNQFDRLTNPKNCECRVLELGHNGKYSLAVHHSVDEMKEWGFSQDMIQDQMIQFGSFDGNKINGE